MSIKSDLIDATKRLLSIVEFEFEHDPEPEDLPSWKAAIEDAKSAIAHAECVVELIEITVVHGSHDWNEFCYVFTDPAEAEKSVLELFKIASMDDLEDAYEDGKWKAFGMETFQVQLK